MLHGRSGIDVTYLIFDVLAAAGDSTMSNPLRQRRALLEEVRVRLAPYVRFPGKRE